MCVQNRFDLCHSESHLSPQVIDRSGAQTGEYTDVSKVEKFEISDDAYEKRTGTVWCAQLFLTVSRKLLLKEMNSSRASGVIVLAKYMILMALKKNTMASTCKY